MKSPSHTMNNYSLQHWRQLAGLVSVIFAGAFVSWQSAMAQPVAKDAMLGGIVRNVIVPGYQELAAKCRALTVAAEELAKNPNSESLEKVRQAWLAAQLASRQVQWLQTGPIADYEYLSTFYYGKVLPNRIEDVLSSSNALDDSYLAELGIIAKNMFTMEHLLFEKRTEVLAKEPQTSVLDLNKLFGTNVQRHCQYLLVVARNVETKADKVSGDWGRTNRQDAAAKFTTGGQTTLNSLMNQAAKIVETVAEGHLDFALHLRSPIAPQLDRIEGARSGTSVPQLLAILRGTHQMYRGGEGLGLDDYVRGLNPALETRVEQQFQKALSALQAIEPPFEVALTDRKESVQLAFEAAHGLEILLKVDLASALGVTITFSSNDGD